MEPSSHHVPAKVPRVAITYCTQCRWMLRAAYFGQELLSTFNTSIGEIALIPATGGIFTIHLTYLPSSAASEDEEEAGGAAASASASAPASGPSPPRITTKEVLIWDRKIDGGFPEAKVLKQRIRDYIDPKRDLGHSDKPASSTAANAATATAERQVAQTTSESSDPAQGATKACEDCA